MLKADDFRVIVVLETKIYVYNFQNLKMIEVIETCSNPRGLCAVCPSKDICVVAAPDKNVGDVRVIHFDDASRTLLINAHQNAIQTLTLTNDGNLLATASDKGTLVRIFCTSTAAQLQELRRGTDHAEIYSLAFDTQSQLIACTSDKGTIHIFGVKEDAVKRALQGNVDEKMASDQGVQGTANTKSMLSFMKGVLPKYFDSEWSFG